MLPTDIQDFIPSSNHFRWYEALWLPKWSVYAFPNAEQYKYIVDLCMKLEMIRTWLGDEPLTITSWLRPELYNKLIGGKPFSMHKLGGAVDFIHPHMTCDHVRERLLPKLPEWKIRMEDNPGSNWVHVDIREPGGEGRFFKP